MDHVLLKEIKGSNAKPCCKLGKMQVKLYLESYSQYLITVSKADATLQLAVLAGDFLLFRAFSAAVSLDNTEVRCFSFVKANKLYYFPSSLFDFVGNIAIEDKIDYEWGLKKYN